MVGGIADVGGLSDCLIGIDQGLASDSILDHYDRVRRDIYNKTINPLSSENFTKLHKQDPETALQEDEFFKACLKAETDLDLSRHMQLVNPPSTSPCVSLANFSMLFPKVRQRFVAA